KEFDTVLAKYKGTGTDSNELVQVLAMKADLYLSVLSDNDKAKEVLKQIQKDFPTTVLAQRVPEIIAQVDQRAEADKLKNSFVVGSQFPDFNETATDDKPISVSQYKGKIVLVDFWATWCGPCMGEVPSVVKTYQKYHDKGFEIVGISLDTDKDKLA